MTFPAQFPIQLGGGTASPLTIADLRKLQAAALSADVGSDVSTFPDLDVAFALMTGRRVLQEAIARRYITPKGALWKHPTYGCDIRRYLNRPMTTQVLAQIKQETEAEAEQEERVLACSNFVTFEDASQTLIIRVGLTDATGPFTFTAAVSKLGLALLQGQE